ncbi:hypothetical protein [Saccharopolyspora sp. NPDC002686]|uniref:hypothetical protein n=1 Tax=Saccharopolyspora sp. NPDC002686 TaxID=3154541 RepID=UPI0033309631
MSEFYDHKAERMAAAGQAEAARADAQVKRAQARAALLTAQAEQERIQAQVRQERADARAERVGSLLRGAAGWLAGHVLELALSLIVIVPAVMAWSAMAAYGNEVYGPVGWGLPLFSEAAMWAFAFAAHAARKDGKPVGWRAWWSCGPG